MKKVILLTIMVCVSTNILAQTEQRCPDEVVIRIKPACLLGSKWLVAYTEEGEAMDVEYVLQAEPTEPKECGKKKGKKK